MNVLAQASEVARKHWPKNRWFKVAFVVGLIILAILGLVALCIWAFVKLIKSLSVGGSRNMDLYMPRPRRRMF